MDGWMATEGGRLYLATIRGREGEKNQMVPSRLGGREKTGRAWGLRQRQQKKKKKGQV
jgi:hypothetical protein